MSFTSEFIKKYKGKTVCFPAGSFCGECLSLAKIYIQERYGIYPPASGCNGARCYWSIFPNPLGTVLKKIPNTPDLIPKEGWMPVWNGNAGKGYGHIGIVSDNSATTSYFNSFDSNWGSRTAQIVKHNYSNVEGFLAPLKENNMASMYKGYDLENKESMKVAVDILVRLQAGEFVETSKLDELVKVKTAELSSKISNYEEENKGLRNQIELLKKDITALNNELEECQTQVPEVGDLEKDWEATGRKIIVQVGDVVTETSYKKKG